MTKYIIQSSYDDSIFWDEEWDAFFSNLKNARRCLRQLRNDPNNNRKTFRLKKVTEEFLDD